MRVTKEQLRKIIKEEMDASIRSAMNQQAGHESEVTYASGKKGTKRGAESARLEKKRLAKARRRTGKTIAQSALGETDGWAPGDRARVGMGDDVFMIDPNSEDEWDLVPGSRTLDRDEPFSLDRDEAGDYELPLGVDIENFSDPYDDDFSYIDSAQRAESLQREASYESYDVLDKGTWSDVIVMSPNGDSVLVGGEETYPEDASEQAEMRASKELGFRVPPVPEHTRNQLVNRLYDGMNNYYVEVAIEYNANTGWKIG